MRTALLGGLLMLGAAAAQAQTQARAPASITLACDLPTRSAAGAPSAPVQRIFRVAPGSLQEWDADRKEFGVNFCEAFSCTRTADRTEGQIGSASVIYTVGVVTSTGQGYWSAAGASGLSANQGACRIVPSPK